MDNGRHCVMGDLQKLLKTMGVKLFNAPVTNPKSVRLSERYAQLVLVGLQALVEAGKRVDLREHWDEHLDAVV